ncbi:hypothetical protein L249_0535 [Ophiocordyceps polyrhachis-furcata BCC 54312]|uniref:Protein kinase domain-containing protein n=1 Tax=Ophiocordyceps polyrhachis-furcata BCC 54312 TaxID=1330021 RepID=A0A367LC89_9HYPO|nr:hypothetical protein L249_0535 [Ophiocordyceps polyrhachis-furcata BCC 54312]
MYAFQKTPPSKTNSCISFQVPNEADDTSYQAVSIRARAGDLPHTADRLWKRLYIRGIDDDLERLHGYRPGGYFPIHIDDELHDGQYRIVHKLGHGGSTRRHTSPSRFLSPARRETNLKDQAKAKQFVSQSPNGTHLCLVFPAVRLQIAQEVSRQTVENLALLHSRGICHGDLRPSNALLELQASDGLIIDFGQSFDTSQCLWHSGQLRGTRGRHRSFSCHDCAGLNCAHQRFQLISEAEAAALADLLEKLLRYQPEDRLAAQDVLKHAWFHTTSTAG